MRRLFVTSLLTLVLSSPAFAKHHHRHHHYRHHHHTAARTHEDGGRPSAWCGWYMRKLLGVADASYNLARNWAHWGSATTPHAGAVVVWPHHVGKIVGDCSGGTCLILSGNDGHAVRTRRRSIAGAIAFRE